MRCSRRSTTWRGRWGAALAAVALLAPGPAAAPPSRAATPESGARAGIVEAIVSAVQSRVGRPAEVVVDRLEASLPRDVPARILAVPEVGTRFGRTMRFAIVEPGPGGRPGRHVGAATADLRVSLDHCRAVRDIPRGSQLAGPDVETGHSEVATGRLQRFPACAELIGGQARRDLAAGEAVESSLVSRPPLVAAGSRVVARVANGDVEVEATLVSLEAGRAGEEIRLMNPDSRKLVRGRVAGANEVEVMR